MCDAPWPWTTWTSSWSSRRPRTCRRLLGKSRSRPTSRPVLRKVAVTISPRTRVSGRRRRKRERRRRSEHPVDTQKSENHVQCSVCKQIFQLHKVRQLHEFSCLETPLSSVLYFRPWHCCWRCH